MATAARKQDMPPTGGFKPLSFARVPARSLFGGKTLIIAHFAFTAGGLYLYSLGHNVIEREKVEQRSSMLAILPLIQAEKDRAYLKQLRRNRDEEAKLMSDVEGWEVGKYKGEPIYKTIPKDTLVNPQYGEYFVHTDGKTYNLAKDIMFWQ